MAVVPGSIPGKIGIFNKKFPPETSRDDEAKLKSLVSVPNTPGLNTRSLHSAYDVNA